MELTEKSLSRRPSPLPGGLKLDILAVLPADVDDGTRLRVAERSRRHLRDDLVYSARAEQTAHTIRARARDRRGDACVRPLQRLKLGAQHLIRLSVMTDIPAIQGRPQPVEQDHSRHLLETNVQAKNAGIRGKTGKRRSAHDHSSPPSVEGCGRKPMSTQ